MQVDILRIAAMEDEEFLNFILEKLYEIRFENKGQSLLALLNQHEIYFRKNQLNRVMADIKSNDFAIISRFEDDYHVQLAPEGIVYCEEVLMLG